MKCRWCWMTCKMADWKCCYISIHLMRWGWAEFFLIMRPKKNKKTKQKKLWLYLKLTAGDRKQCMTKTSLFHYTVCCSCVLICNAVPCRVTWKHRVTIKSSLSLQCIHVCVCACVEARESIPHLAFNKKEQDAAVSPALWWSSILH